MSLSLLFNSDSQIVVIAEWFRDPKFSLEYASGPVVTMSFSEFQKMGPQLAREHAIAYAKKTLTPQEALPLFRDGVERKVVNKSVAIWLKNEKSGTWSVIPQLFHSARFIDTENLPDETHRVLPSEFTDALFNATIEEAFKLALFTQCQK